MAGDKIDQYTFNRPAAAAEGDLLVVAIALTFAPEASVPACPGAAAVIVPPAGWTTVLADFPGGENALGDFGSGDECDRLGVYTRQVGPIGAEPATYIFDWAGGGSVSAAMVIVTLKAGGGVSGVYPAVNVAAPAVNIIAAGLGNPVTCEAPSVTTTQANTTLLAIFVARNGTWPSPPGDGLAFTTPAGMTELENEQSQLPPTNPIGMGVFYEVIPTAGATGVRTSDCDINTGNSNIFLGMGYALAIAGCGGSAP